jgi:hypothetical protein
MRINARRLTLKLCVILVVAVCTLGGAPPDELYSGWLGMYDLNFQDAHRRISR